MKPLLRIAVLLKDVTATSARPAARWPVVAVIEDVLTTATFVVGTPPIVTTASAAKFVPEMVTVVPPNVLPLVGEIDVATILLEGVVGDEAPPHDASRSARLRDAQKWMRDTWIL